MKMIWAALSVPVVVLLAVLGISIHTSRLHDDLQQSLEAMEKTVQEESWVRADREAGDLENLWDRTDRFLSPVMDHACIDRVDETITRVIRMARGRQREELLVEIGVARRQITRLKERESPSLRNVF